MWVMQLIKKIQPRLTFALERTVRPDGNRDLSRGRLPILFLIAIFLLSVLQSKKIFAQNGDTSKLKIALFAPLYLDSAFDYASTYRYGKNFPKFLNPGLEFYEGAQLALDSLKKEGVPLEVFVFDSRAANTTISQQLSSPALENVGLIIAHTTASEIRIFAEVALKLKVPFINANLPNDGAINANPYFVLLNPTLRTQCEGIYKFVQKYYATKSIVVFRKKGQMEDMIKNYFNDYSKLTSSVPLKLKYVDLNFNFNPDELKSHLDSNRQTVCMAGSLDEIFGRTLAWHLASLNKTYPVIIIGMPTWDNIKDFNKPEYKALEIIYSTPFYNAKTDKVSYSITNDFNSKMFARPSDMVFRGYEVTMRFARLLAQYKKDIASNLGTRQNKVFTEFDIQPVFLNRQNMTLDYFENKKLYFIKFMDGEIKSVLN